MNSKPGNTTEQCAYERGRQAKRNGQNAKTNPHKKGTVPHRWWQFGFEEVADVND